MIDGNNEDSAAVVEAHEAPEVTTTVWRASAIGILLIGALLRLYHLSLVPLHHDEGVNGLFLKYLVSDGYYRYDPENYHGPTLYYLSAIIPWISRLLLGNEAGEKYGLTIFTIRLIPALLGVLTIWLVLSLRKQIGDVGALAAAALLAVSPGAVYLSRYFIHETFLVCFTLGAVITALKFYQTARSGYLLLMAGLVAMMFATKETAVISAGVLVIALASTLVFIRFRKLLEAPENEQPRIEPHDSPPVSSWSVKRFGGASSLVVLTIAAISVFLTINLLFYSSFFKNYPQGVFDAIQTFKFWTKTGTQVHVHPWSTYLSWMWRKETVLLLFGTVGIGLAMWRGRNPFAVFSALWAFGIVLAYSLIPYKTPWLMLNFALPLAIVAGYAVQEIYRQAKSSSWQAVPLVIGAAALSLSIYQTVTLNFFRYDDPTYVYVYAHTYRDFLPLVDEINRIADRAGTGKRTEITVTAPEYWPLPWYLKDYTQTKFPGRLLPTTNPIVVGSDLQAPELQALLGARYVVVRSKSNPLGTFPLRPHQDLVLLVRDDLLTK